VIVKLSEEHRAKYYSLLLSFIDQHNELQASRESNIFSMPRVVKERLLLLFLLISCNINLFISVFR
jgi:hypothetical protein